MLTVLSPAKRLAARPIDLPDGLAPTRPAFAAQASELADVARALTPAALRKLMHISEPLALLNRDRFAAFHDARTTEAPAVALFDGDT